MSTTAGVRYELRDAAMLRACATRDVDLPPWPGFAPFAPGADVKPGTERWRSWLCAVWADESFSAAVAVASPQLADRVREATSTGEHRSPADPQALRRLALTVARYWLRARGRATPFGLFAGVAGARFSADGSVAWSESHRVTRGVDAAWLATVIDRLEACPAVLSRLRVAANDLAIERAGRLTLRTPRRGRAATASDPGATAAPHEISIRLNAITRAILQYAAKPRTVPEITDDVSSRFPTVAAEQTRAVLAQLLDAGFLTSCLRPPSTTGDGVRHVLAQLQDIGAHDLDELREIVGQLHRWVTGPVPATTPRPDFAATTTSATAATAATHLALSADLTVPSTVAREIERAAGVLGQLAREPGDHPDWSSYHAAFLDRFGFHALVPVPELVNATTGLGLPRHFDHHPAGAGVGRMLTTRDTALLTLAHGAALDGAEEVELDQAWLSALSAEPERTPPVGPASDLGEARRAGLAHLDLGVELRADSLDAAADGRFQLSITGVGRSALATTGRFLDLLPDTRRDRAMAALAELPASVRGATTAQLSFPALRPHAENVGRAPTVLATLLELGGAESPTDSRRADSRLRLRDLAVTGDARGLFLISVADGRVVEPVVAHALAPHVMPPLARLLAELAYTYRPAARRFSWGAADTLPYLPRLRSGRTVLAERRWRLDPRVLPGPGASGTQWRAAWERERDRLGLPEYVHLGHGDQHLRLNVERDPDLAVLRDHLDRHQTPTSRSGVRPEPAGTVTISEAAGPAERAWIAGRVHEIVVPLTARTSVAIPEPRAATALRTSIAGDTVRCDAGTRTVHATGAPLLGMSGRAADPPRTAVLSARLDCLPEAVPTVIAEHVPALLARWDRPPLWWFVPVRNPRPHLRLRLPVPEPVPGCYGFAAEAVQEWAAQLRGLGLCGELIIDTYHPEIFRYGGSTATMSAAEAVFHADSVAVRAQLTALTGAVPGLEPRVLTAVSLVDLAAGLHGSRDAGLTWLSEHPSLVDGGHLRDPQLHRRARHLDATPAALPHALHVAWRRRRMVLQRYRHELARAVPAGPTTPDPTLDPVPATVGVSLLHLHHVRALGADPETEAQTHRLARGIGLGALHTRTPRRSVPNGQPR